MKILVRSIFMLLGVMLFAAANADRPLSIQYAGTGFSTSYNPTPDTLMSLPAGIINADSFGSFGDSDTTIVYEFGIAAEQTGCGADEVRFELLWAEGVITFADHSQLYAYVTSGWMCMVPEGSNAGRFAGFVTGGMFIGGTGRFAGKTGTFTGPFEGQNFGPHVDLIGITGTMEGSLTK